MYSRLDKFFFIKQMIHWDLLQVKAHSIVNFIKYLNTFHERYLFLRLIPIQCLIWLLFELGFLPLITFQPS